MNKLSRLLDDLVFLETTRISESIAGKIANKSNNINVLILKKR